MRSCATEGFSVLGRRLDVVSMRGFQRHIGMQGAWEAEEALVRLTGARLLAPNIPRRQYWLQQNRLARSLRRIAPTFGQNPFLGARGDVVIFLMAVDKSFFPLLQDRRRRKWIYVFDTWEPQWAMLEALMQQWRNVSALYLASSQAAEHFAGRVPFPATWLPQAGDCRQFIAAEAESAAAGPDAVMNIGRLNPVLTPFFDDFCARHGLRHLRARFNGEVPFPDRTSFLSALLQSRIVVVHPRNLGDPGTTGRVSMLTSRYFEAYNTGAVVCGFQPTSGEFDKVLSGYPFIEYRDPTSFERELLRALETPEIWREAQRRVRAEHTWDVRLSPVLAGLRSGMVSPATATVPPQ